MKLKSELYVYELNLLLYGLTIQMRFMSETLRRRKKLFVIKSFLMPWAATKLHEAILMEASAVLEHAKKLSELKDKIMEAQGLDDKMKPITFSEILEKEGM